LKGIGLGFNLSFSTAFASCGPALMLQQSVRTSHVAETEACYAKSCGSESGEPLQRRWETL